MFAAVAAGPATTHAPAPARLAAVPTAATGDAGPAIAEPRPAAMPAATATDAAPETGANPAFGLIAVGPPSPLGGRALWAVAFADCTEDELERLAATPASAP